MTTTSAPAVPAPAPDATPAPAAPAADPTALAARDAELNALAETDLPRYRYADGGALANEHVAVRRALAAAKQTVPPAEQAEGDTIVGDEDVAEAEDAEGESDGDATEDAEAGELETAELGPQWDLEDYEYAVPEGQQVTEAGEKLIGEFRELAHRHSMPPEAFTAAIDFVQEQQARLVEADKAARADLVAGLKAELGDAYAGFKRNVDSAFRGLPAELQAALRSARLPDGRLLASLPETVHLLHSLSQARHDEWRADEAQTRGNRATLQAELRDLDHLMRTDIDSYRREWRGLGLTASERRLQIMRELGSQAPAKPSAADLRAEMRELEQLRARDPQMFMFGSWRGTGRPPADRLVALQSGRP